MENTSEQAHKQAWLMKHEEQNKGRKLVAFDRLCCWLRSNDGMTSHNSIGRVCSHVELQSAIAGLFFLILFLFLFESEQRNQTKLT